MVEKSRSAQARELAHSRLVHQEVIGDLKVSAPTIQGTKGIYAMRSPGGLYVCVVMESADDAEWDKLYRFEVELGTKYKGFAMVFDEVDLIHDGEEKLEELLPEGAELIYPEPKQQPPSHAVST